MTVTVDNSFSFTSNPLITHTISTASKTLWNFQFEPTPTPSPNDNESDPSSNGSAASSEFDVDPSMEQIFNPPRHDCNPPKYDNLYLFMAMTMAIVIIFMVVDMKRKSVNVRDEYEIALMKYLVPKNRLGEFKKAYDQVYERIHFYPLESRVVHTSSKIQTAPMTKLDQLIPLLIEEVKRDLHMVVLEHELAQKIKDMHDYAKIIDSWQKKKICKYLFRLYKRR
eukprot:78162_1